jgi:hypothetical protein
MSTTPSPSPACTEKTRLINDVLEADKRIASIQIERRETVVAVSGEPTRGYRWSS